MHASPVAGHMGEYENLYRIRICFFWPRIRADIKKMDPTIPQLYPNMPLATTRLGVDVFLAC